eukprot:scaffold7842_cov27-Tisochrysis_lutea.AAC.2
MIAGQSHLSWLEAELLEDSWGRQPCSRLDEIACGRRERVHGRDELSAPSAICGTSREEEAAVRAKFAGPPAAGKGMRRPSVSRRGAPGVRCGQTQTRRAIGFARTATKCGVALCVGGCILDECVLRDGESSQPICRVERRCRV